MLSLPSPPYDIVVADMNVDAAVQLLRKGKDAWNAWAAEMAAQREKLIKNGQWDEESIIEGDNTSTSTKQIAWMEEAKVKIDLASIRNFEINGFVFPWDLALRVGFDYKTAKLVGCTIVNKLIIDIKIDGAKLEISNTSVHGGFTLNAMHQTLDLIANYLRVRGQFKLTANAILSKVNLCGSTFEGDCIFDIKMVTSDFGFSDSHFFKLADFSQIQLEGRAEFSHCTFHDVAKFEQCRFGDISVFEHSTFKKMAMFSHSTFKETANFSQAKFEGESRFSAITCNSGFMLDDAEFSTPPDFTQASFTEAPILSKSRFRGAGQAGFLGRLAGNLSHVDRWRALRRLAIAAHDHEKEQEFFALELAAGRFAPGWWQPLRFWRRDAYTREAWATVPRFWLGWLYSLFSDTGRSLMRPFGWWLVGIGIAASFLIAQVPDRFTPAAGSAGALTLAGRPAPLAPLPWLSASIPCYDHPAAPAVDTPASSRDIRSVTGLSAELRGQTDASAEAWHLALRNALVVLDTSSEAAHRTYGCLYGVELYGETPVPIVPPAVSIIGAVQKLWSAVMIFLFGLALRNLLRMR